MDGRMRAAQTNEQQMEQTEPRMDAKRPPKKPPGQAMPALTHAMNGVISHAGQECQGRNPFVSTAADSFPESHTLLTNMNCRSFISILLLSLIGFSSQFVPVPPKHRNSVTLQAKRANRETVAAIVIASLLLTPIPEKSAATSAFPTTSQTVSEVRVTPFGGGFGGIGIGPFGGFPVGGLGFGLRFQSTPEAEQPPTEKELLEAMKSQKQMLEERIKYMEEHQTQQLKEQQLQEKAAKT
jgi:hypothetical protein